MNYSILIAESDNYSSEAISIYSSIGKVKLADLNKDQLLKIIPEYDVIVVRLRNYLDEEFFEKAIKLSYIVTNTTGHTHINLSCAKRNGVEILSLKGEKVFLSNITPTAELTWGLLLNLIRKVNKATVDVNEGIWNRYKYPGETLNGKTLGIIGYGRLG